MLKKVLAFVLTLALTLGAFISLPESASADYSPTNTDFGENITYSLSEDGVLTLSGEGVINRIIIDDHDLGAWIVLNRLRSDTVSIVIENGITGIGISAFAGFDNVTDVTIPASVKNLAPFAFENCKKLKNVTISSGLHSIEHEAFQYCTSLENISLPDTLTIIGYNAFAECESIKTLELPAGLKTVEESAFYPCVGLESIEVKRGNTEFSSADGVLFNKDKTKLISYPSSKTSESYTIPDGVKSVESRAFMICKYLKEITIPGNVTIMPENFDSCELLAKITLGDGVTGVSRNLLDATAYYQDEQNWEGDALYIGKYLIAVKETCTAYEIKDGTETICGYAFYSCEMLENVTMPDSITSIGDNSFFGCRSLKTITIPEGVTRIPDDCFLCCSELISITLPSGLKNIGESAFAQCGALKSIIVPESVISIGNGAFILDDITIYGYFGSYIHEYADNNGIKFVPLDNPFGKCGDSLTWKIEVDTGMLTITGTGDMDNWLEHVDTPWFPYADDIKAVKIESGVTSIGGYAFCALTNVKSVYIPESVVNMKDHCFWGCESLESIIIPNGVECIDYCAFADCKSLKSVMLPDSLKSMENHCFQSCTSLESIVIPYGVTSIESDAFADCKNLKSVTLPDSLKNMKSYCFRSCKCLESIVIPDGVTTIEFCAFLYCSNLVSVTIPKSVTNINDTAFIECNDLVISGYSGSYAEKYANENKIKFTSLDSQDTNIEDPTDSELPTDTEKPTDSDKPDDIIGDLNGDGVVTMEDVVLLQKYIAKLSQFTPEQIKLADVNADDDITMLDVTTIQKYIAKLIDEF